MHWADVITIAVCFAAFVGVGAWWSRRSASTEAYFVANRSFPGWAVGLSMMASTISSITFVTYPGSAYAGNWSRIVPALMLPIGAVVAVYLLVPLYRACNLVSAYEYLERRFGPWGRVFGCLTFTIASAARMGVVLFLLCLPLQIMTGWSPATTILVAGSVVTVYTVMGGIQGVMWVDLLRSVMLAAGGILTIAVVLLRVPGGAPAVLSGAWSDGKFDLTVSFDWSLARDTFLVLVINGVALQLHGFATDQTRIQRYCAARSPGAARTAVWIGGLGCIPIWALFMLVGSCLYVYYRTFPAHLPAAAESDKILPYFILNELPPGLGGIVIAALLSASFAISSNMNGTAAVVTADIYRRHIAPSRSDRHYVLFARVISVVMGLFMIVMALTLTVVNLRQQTVLDIWFVIEAVTAGGLGGFVYLGFLSTRANSKGAAVGVAMGVAIVLWLALAEVHVLPSWLCPALHPFLIGAIGNVVALVVGYAASYLFPARPREELVGLTWWAEGIPAWRVASPE
jgi:SSS family solute:Na+ symporter